MGNWMARVAVLTWLGCIGCGPMLWFIGPTRFAPPYVDAMKASLAVIGVVCLVVACVATLDVIFGGHRHRTGWRRCIVCGYDLRCSPDRCPECGTVPEKEPSRSEFD